MVFAFKDKKSAKSYINFLKIHSKNFNVKVRPKIIIRPKEKYKFVVIERAKNKRK